MKLFFELVENEERARRQAGFYTAQGYDAEEYENLKDQGKERLLNKYRISNEQSYEIAIEGINKGWPMPEPKL